MKPNAAPMPVPTPEATPLDWVPRTDAGARKLIDYVKVLAASRPTFKWLIGVLGAAAAVIVTAAWAVTQMAVSSGAKASSEASGEARAAVAKVENKLEEHEQLHAKELQAVHAEIHDGNVRQEMRLDHVEELILRDMAGRRK